LILQAMVSGKGGEIFVLDMGEPIKIRYLAEQMIRLSGKNIDIIYTGLRPGEKLFEELFHTDERLAQTEHTKLYQATARPCSWNELQSSLTLLIQACEQCDEREMKFLVHGLVPELLKSTTQEVCC
jgi:FlaA1/EpsC-like NDP-sugar epimerase